MKIQAAESLTNGILAVNKWSDGTTELTNNIANVTLNQSNVYAYEKGRVDRNNADYSR